MHQYEMNNVKAFARHHAMEFLKTQLNPILEGFKLEQRCIIKEYYEMKKREQATAARVTKQTKIMNSQEV